MPSAKPARQARELAFDIDKLGYQKKRGTRLEMHGTICFANDFTVEGPSGT
jgi:hypothetical protein